MTVPALDNQADPTLVKGTSSLDALGMNLRSGTHMFETVLHYQIQEKLGEGGMGVVYKALDRKLNRFVALKFLPSQVDRSDVNLDRFIHEANVLSALNHPHIATIYSVETALEQQFLVLEYLSGGTLKAKLRQVCDSGGALSIEDVLDYAQQTAEGLAHAHARGIIHRDIKTSNLMLTSDGSVKITDFGIAKLAGSSLGTIPGSLLGTIAYMSPEQALGMDVDSRSDVFSFGVSLFELIAGRLPFEAPNDAALITRVANARAPELKTLRTDVPPSLASIVERALKKRPDERYGAMSDLLADIRGLREHRSSQTRLVARNEIRPVVTSKKRLIGTVAVMLVAVLAAALVSWSQWVRRSQAVTAARALTTNGSPKTRSTQQAANRLAVLPFRSIWEEHEALPEKVMTALTKNLVSLEQFRGSLSIVPPDEVLKEKVTSVREAITKLEATLILTGAVTQADDRLIITANLVDTKSQIVVNATDLDIAVGSNPRMGNLSEFTSPHGSLIEKVAEMLQLQMAEAPGPRELYLQGRGYLERYDRMENLEKAISLFEQALTRDPKYALAHAGRAEAYLRKYRLTMDVRLLDGARESITAAMQLNDQLSPVHFTMGLFHVAIGNHERAIESFERSIRIDSGADAVRELANSYHKLHRLEEAEETYRQAIQLRRGYWAGYKDLAVFYQNRGRLQEARPLFELVARLAPDDWSSYTNLFAVYFKLKMYSEAATAMQYAVSIDPSAVAYQQLGAMLYFAHRYRDAIDAYTKSIEINPRDGEVWGALGDAYRYVPGMADSIAEAYKNAVALKEEELKVRPRDAKLRAHIASWSVLTDRKRALREIRTAVRLDPNNSRVQALAALVYEQSGLRNKAIAAVESAIKLGYSIEEIRNWPPFEQLRQDPRYKQIIAMRSEGASVPSSNK